MSAAPAAVGFRSERGPVLISVMLSTGLVAIDSTVLATAIPSIVGELGGFHQFPWLFSAYLLGQAVTTPVYAKLSDLFGRKPILLLGIGLFLVGSILCAAAWNMLALIVFRAVQGLGAGAVQPTAMTIVGDIYTVAERARVQGYLASVWAVSSVVGPMLGGVFSQLGIWRGVFLVNIPLCVLAAWMFHRHFHETVTPRHSKVDILGAVLLTSSMTSLVLAVLGGGQSWPWTSAPSIGAFTAGAVLLVAFVGAERRAPEPILPLWVFSRRLLCATTVVAFGVGAILMGLTSYVPTYLEGSLNTTPIVAGLALAALTIGWPATAAVAGRFYLRWGFKRTALIGATLVVGGSAVLAAVANRPNVAVVAVVCFVIGAGMGLLAVPTLIAAQASVDWHERGVVTGTNMFARSLGSALGVAIFGAIANSIFGSGDIHSIGPAAIRSGSAAVFAAVLVVAVATAVAVLAMPRTPASDHAAPVRE
ncbi:MFS transporter [Mycobacterium antarcticum]|uniref:MFS transporter n=1 Tax=unclassified Mycolicibacterium TaxID=2636767 RepID=UPI0023A3499E|nr:MULTISPECIES: MFS transporter [unclassified Mycolicibacterium]GLP78363.1 MFS transporter [Mycolicibacterium sp. TUM20983]GLP81413.1 MFS transporter [Mycolicibacterium sp. TUM20984]